MIVCEHFCETFAPIDLNSNLLDHFIKALSSNIRFLAHHVFHAHAYCLKEIITCCIYSNLVYLL